jgi:transcriptional regulator with XRE-family HTH domain
MTFNEGMGTRPSPDSPKEQKWHRSELKRLGAEIQSRRKAMGFTQETFAEHIGVSDMSIRFIETGRSAPSIHMLLKIAYALKVKITFLGTTK